MKRSGSSSVILLMGMGLGGCAESQREPGVTRTDSAGVEVVESPGTDVTLAWGLERLFSLGGEAEGPESFDVVTPESVGVDPSGRLLVLDMRARRVVVFDADGTFLKEYGREGEGPGEMSNPASLAVAPDGSVSIFDYGRGGLVRFGPDGEPLSPVPFAFYPWPGQPRHLAYSGDALLVASQVFEPVETATFRYALQRVSEMDTTLIADRTFSSPERTMYPECGGGINLPRLFEMGITWAADGTSVWVNRDPSYEIEQYEGGTLKRRIRRDLSVREATDAMALEELGEGFRINFGRGACTIPARVMVDRRGFAPELPWLARATAAPGGSLWVLRREVGQDAGPIDVFDPSGAYLGTMPSGTPFPIVFLGTDRFGVAETDAFDVTRLVVYRLNRS